MTRKHKLCYHSQPLSDQYRISNWYVSPKKLLSVDLFFFGSDASRLQQEKMSYSQLGPQLSYKARVAMSCSYLCFESNFGAQLFIRK